MNVTTLCLMNTSARQWNRIRINPQSELE